jgi:hypothetical protein
MGWFSKKEAGTPIKEVPPSLPKLPELPELPDIDDDLEEPIHQLPTYPTTSFGQKFSQNTIKEAVTGTPKQQSYDRFPREKEVERVFEADEFAINSKPQMMQKPSKQQVKIPEMPKMPYSPPKTREIEEETKPQKIRLEMPPRKQEIEEPEEFEEEEPQERYKPSIMKTKKTEPVFIRIDKFEESLKSLEKTKKQLSDIENNLEEIIRTKAEEQKELDVWMSEIIKVKGQIEKIERDVFSQIE